MDRRCSHETLCCVAMGVLGGLLRLSIEHRPPRLRHDPGPGFDRARRAARLPFRTAGLRNLSRLRIPGHSRLLSGRFSACAAVPQGPPDRLEERLAPPPPLAFLERVRERALDSS